MRRTVMMVMMCAALAMPLVTSADDQSMPPEAQWTPTPPARWTVDANQLASVLVDTGDDHPARGDRIDLAAGVFALAAQPRQGVGLGGNRSPSRPECGW